MDLVLLGTVDEPRPDPLKRRSILRSDFAPVALIVLVAAICPPLMVHRVCIPQIDMSFGSGRRVFNAPRLRASHSAIGVRISIPYRGSAPAMQDLAAGRIDYLCDAVTTALPQVQARTVKGLAVFARKRFSILPDVPTADEQGLANFEASNWIGLFFPRGAPAAIIRRLNAATLDAMATPLVQERMQTLGTDLVSPQRATPDYLQRFVASEIDKWAEPIKASGVSVD